MQYNFARTYHLTIKQGRVEHNSSYWLKRVIFILNLSKYADFNDYDDCAKRGRLPLRRSTTMRVAVNSKQYNPVIPISSKYRFIINIIILFIVNITIHSLSHFILINILNPALSFLSGSTLPVTILGSLIYLDLERPHTPVSVLTNTRQIAHLSPLYVKWAM